MWERERDASSTKGMRGFMKGSKVQVPEGKKCIYLPRKNKGEKEGPLIISVPLCVFVCVCARARVISV